VAFVEFDEVNFFDAAFVAAAGEGCAEESLDHFDGLRAVDDASTEGQNVGVIVFAGELGGVDIVGECGADAGNFVGRDGNTDTGATNGDAEFILVRDDALADGFAVVGIIDGFFGPGTEVVDGVAGILQELANRFFDWKSGVIGAEGNAWLARSVGHARLVGGILTETGWDRNWTTANKENIAKGRVDKWKCCLDPSTANWYRAQFSGRDTAGGDAGSVGGGVEVLPRSLHCELA
jgi:hypothetical protein